MASVAEQGTPKGVKHLIEDLQSLGEKHPEIKITRNFYRANGSFKETVWQKHYATFSDFLAAAGLLTVEPAKAPEPETSEIAGNQWTITLPKTRIQTLEELLDHCKVDLAIWEVERFIVNKYEMGYTVGSQDNKKGAVEALFQVKATLRKRPDVLAIRREIDSLKEEAKGYMPVVRPVVYTTQDSENLLELLIPDLHIGKLAYAKETGFQNYDTRIAVDTYKRAVDALLSQAQNYNFDRIVLGVGNDLLQTDNSHGTTFSGTQVDTDSRYCKVYKTARKMLTDTVEQLRKIAPVDVKLVPGNHDTQSVFTMGDSLECFFHNYQDVYVDNAPIMHKIVEWGDVLLALMHGHQGKKADFGIWMASMYPRQFGRTKFREIHVGHRHTSSLEEKYGIRVRTFSALCPPDEWHASGLMTGNLRVAEALVFNKTKGLTAQLYHTEID